MRLTGRSWAVASDVVDFRSPLGVIRLHRTTIEILEWQGSSQTLISVAEFLVGRIGYEGDVIAEALKAFDGRAVGKDPPAKEPIAAAPLDRQPVVDVPDIVESDAVDEPAAEDPDKPPDDDDEGPSLDF